MKNNLINDLKRLAKDLEANKINLKQSITALKLTIKLYDK